MKALIKCTSSIIVSSLLIVLASSVVFAQPAEQAMGIKELNQLSIAKEKIGDFDEYGSFFIDKNGKHVLALSKENAKTNEIINNLKESLPEDKLVIKKGHKYSTKELKSINKDLANLSELNKDGSNITATYMDEELGKVVIEATKITDSLSKKLTESYGEVLDIRIGPSYQGAQVTLTRTDNFGLLGGGIAINNSSCTLAATATKGNDRFLITAGHCLTGNGTSEVKQNTTKVGIDWAKGVSQDIGIIKVTESGRWISNKILRNSSTDYDGKYTSAGSVTQGQTVCKAGIKTGEKCFKVLSTSINTTNYPDQIKLENPNWINQEHGDSGAPMYSNSTFSYVLYGVMSQKSKDTGPDAFATATKISYFNTYFPDYSLYTSDTNTFN
ncbi:S1 family peptidase [Paenibacillus chitinolyticus]|uniref:S1 family peptidase n=1 Tax=Paenibacillus chitinolyticus TaxID=79263 RepID=UPI002DBE40A1|nr:S1 family peptidase [Paenibacillus chitinolyticus]MEC0248601.1 S1 family peptidase [Paenibacillus chitinolyticus]